MRYLFGFLVSIGLIILILVLIFSGHGSKSATVPGTSKPVESYAGSDAEVRMIVDGPINSSQIHQQIRITVNNQNVIYQQMTGYDGQIVNEQVYPNSTASYYNFLRAIDFAGFQQGNTDKSMTDERARCPLGTRYTFDMDQDGNNLEHFWSTSCNSGTYLGNVKGTITLFKAQVPNYSDLTKLLQSVQS